jgi:hypothetical protein
MYRGKSYMPKTQELKNIVLREMCNVPYVGQPRYHKTIAPRKSQYFFLGLKQEVDAYIAKCLECQNVKADIDIQLDC